MLDAKTMYIFVLITTMTMAVIWMFVWVSQRQRYDLKFIAFGYLFMALGILLLPITDLASWSPILFLSVRNYLVQFGVIFIVYGLARFLGQSGAPKLQLTCAGVALLFWPLALIVDPDNVAIRVVAHDTITTVLVGYLIYVLAVDRTQPRVLRLSTIVLLGGEIIALSLRSFLALSPEAVFAQPFNPNDQTWYMFVFHFFMMVFFLLKLMMVGMSLSSDLRRRHEDLHEEMVQRRTLQARLADSLKTEQVLRAEQTQLVRLVTHEFRTPMAVIDRAAEMMELTHEASAERLSSIRGAILRLSRLIDRFLDAERRDVDIMDPQNVEVEELLDDVRHHFEIIGKARRLRFVRDPEFPGYRGDPAMLAMVLINLIDNAMKYAPGDSAINVEARNGEGEIILSVTDKGIGIPDAELQSIGQRHYRASNTLGREGVGLGVYNVRRLLDYHQGALSLENAEEGGLIATVRLPLNTNNTNAVSAA